MADIWIADFGVRILGPDGVSQDEIMCNEIQQRLIDDVEAVSQDIIYYIKNKYSLDAQCEFIIGV